MKTVSISVTEAARNFSDCINRVRYQGVTFILNRNGVPVARIEPVPGATQPEAKVAKQGAAGSPGSAKPDRAHSRRGQ